MLRSPSRILLPMFLTCMLIGLPGCGDLPQTEADRKVQELKAAMDAGTFRLGVGLERIADVMGRAADSRERRGNERLLTYNMDDGSKVVFVVVPRGGEGSNIALELAYVTAWGVTAK